MLAKETAKDPVLTNVIRYTREGWSLKSQTDHKITHGYSVEDFRRISTSLSSVHGVLLNGTRLVIPGSLHPQVLQLLHAGHFGMQRMKQLAQTAVYWPRIDVDIMEQNMTCGVQNTRMHPRRPLITHGCYLRSHGVVCILTTP